MDSRPWRRQLRTKFFGEIECSADEHLEFPQGLPGFEQHRQFVLLDQPATRPLVFLQSVEEQDLCFAALPLQKIAPECQIHLTPEEAAQLDAPVSDQELLAQQFLQLAFVSLNEGGPTANLLAPVVIHVATRRGMQLIQWESGLSSQQPISPLWERPSCS